jgi:hypothetical protein
MASSSTNKQPLLIDAPFMRVVRLDNTSMPADIVDPGTATNGALILDCIANDGALVESIWLIQRAASNVTEVRLFLSTSNLAMGVGLSGSPSDSQYLASAVFAAAQPVGATVEFVLPPVLFPVAPASANASATPHRLRGLRVEKGKALWAAARTITPDFTVPQIAIQGGFH